jgi:hypothetical protein
MQVLDLSSTQQISMNFTGLLLREICELRFDIVRDRTKEAEKEGSVLTASALSTVGLRRAIESRPVRFANLTDVDVQVARDTGQLDFDSSFAIKSGMTRSFDIGKVREGEAYLTMCIASSCSDIVGDREPIYRLPVTTQQHSEQLFLLRPRGFFAATTPNAADIFDGFGGHQTGTRETVVTDGTVADKSNSNIEPVVEWCMENQRLRPSTVDMYSLEKGRDLLSNGVWSPDDTVGEDFAVTNRTSADKDLGASTKMLASRVTSPKQRHPNTANKSNWSKPYLHNDSPEW